MNVDAGVKLHLSLILTNPLKELQQHTHILHMENFYYEPY